MSSEAVRRPEVAGTQGQEPADFLDPGLTTLTARAGYAQTLAPKRMWPLPMGFTSRGMATNRVLAFPPQTCLHDLAFCDSHASQRTGVIAANFQPGRVEAFEPLHDQASLARTDTEFLRQPVSVDGLGHIGQLLKQGSDDFFDPQAWAGFSNAALQVLPRTAITTVVIGGVVLAVPVIAGELALPMAELTALINAMRQFDTHALEGMRSFSSTDSAILRNVLPLMRRWSYKPNDGVMWQTVNHRTELAEPLVTKDSVVDGVVHIVIDPKAVQALGLRAIEALRLGWFRSLYRQPDLVEDSYLLGLLREWAAHAFSRRSLMDGWRLAARDPRTDPQGALWEFLYFALRSGAVLGGLSALKSCWERGVDKAPPTGP